MTQNSPEWHNGQNSEPAQRFYGTGTAFQKIDVCVCIGIGICYRQQTDHPKVQPSTKQAVAPLSQHEDIAPAFNISPVTVATGLVDVCRVLHSMKTSKV